MVCQRFHRMGACELTLKKGQGTVYQIYLTTCVIEKIVKDLQTML